MEPEVKKEYKYLPVLAAILVMLFISAGVVVGVCYYRVQQVKKIAEENKKNSIEQEKKKIDNNNATTSSDYKNYQSNKYNLSFSYPSNWGSVVEEDYSIFVYVNDKEILDGGFNIDINSKYIQYSSDCKFCFTYSADVKDKKIFLSNKNYFTQDIIQGVPRSSQASGNDSRTDYFKYLEKDYMISLTSYKNDSKEDAQTNNEIFEKIVGSIRFD